MGYITRSGSLFAAAVIFFVSVNAQVTVIQPQPPEVTTVDISIQEGCPVKASYAESKSTRIPVLLINIENLDTRAVRGYVVVTSTEKGKHVSTTLYPGDALKAGGSDKRGFSAYGGTRFELMIDYVLFEDGTSWGADAYGRSRLIASFLEGRELAEKRLENLISEADHAVFLPKTRGLASVTMGEMGDNLKPVNEASQRRNGYDNLLFRLRGMQTRNAEARELARKLEVMQYP